MDWPVFETNKVYRIQHVLTGLFKDSGSNPRWSKKGKVWREWHHAIANIRLAKETLGYALRRNTNPTGFDFENWEIKTYEIKEVESQPVENFWGEL